MFSNNSNWKQSRALFVGGMVVGAGAMWCLGRASEKKKREDLDGNILSSIPIPRKLQVQNQEGGFFFGYIPAPITNGVNRIYSDRFCGKSMNQDGNILILGGPGSGKTTGPINHTLKTWSRGNIIALDCKGGMANLWRQIHKNDNKRLLLFAPYRENEITCTYNPFAKMQLDSNCSAECAWELSASLIEIPISDREPVWKKTAQNILAGVLLHCFNEGQSFVEAIQTVNSHTMPELMNLIKQSNSEKAKEFVNKIYTVSGKTMASIGMEMNEIPRLILNQKIVDSLTPKPDRPFLDWNQLNTSKESFDVIIEIPGAKLEQCAPLVRLLFTQLVKTLSLRREKTYSNSDLPSTVLLIDEFPQLGYMRPMVNALATLRSKGVTIALCAQSIAFGSNIREAETRTILDTCQYKVIFNSTDPKSQAYLSALIGGTNVCSCSVSLGFNLLSVSFSEVRRLLVYPEYLAYLQSPIVTSPYGVCQVRKGCLYPKHSEQDFVGRATENVSNPNTESKTAGYEQDKVCQNRPDKFDENACGNKSGQDTNPTGDMILAYCKTERSADEIMQHFNILSRIRLRELYLKPLMEKGLLIRTYPDKPTSPKQKYVQAKNKPVISNSDISDAHLSVTDHKEESEAENNDC